jgi:hypothetical protein
MDALDGNWLNVTVHYTADGAFVAVAGAILDNVKCQKDPATGCLLDHERSSAFAAELRERRRGSF